MLGVVCLRCSVANRQTLAAGADGENECDDEPK